MNQTDTLSRREAERKRQEYLRRKNAAELLVVAYTIVMVAGGLTATIALMYGVFGIVARSSSVSVDQQPETVTLMMTLLVGIFGYLAARQGRRGRRSAERRARHLRYVPPVHEPIERAPAENMLLRASDNPAAAPAELLRPALAGAETEAAELLRADNTVA